MRQILTQSAQLGQILTSRRRALKLSQRDLAAKLAMSQNRLSEIEANPGAITVERLLALTNLLGLELTIQNKPATPSPIVARKTEW
jgi:HTH-type transcriptional regulator / antitoxin HipB